MGLKSYSTTYRSHLQEGTQKDLGKVSKHGGRVDLVKAIMYLENYPKRWVEMINNEPLAFLFLIPETGMMDGIMRQKYYDTLTPEEQLEVERKMYSFLIEMSKRMKLGYLRIPYFKGGFDVTLPPGIEAIELSSKKGYKQIIGWKAVMIDPVGIEIRFRGKHDITKLTQDLSSVIPLPFDLTCHASADPITTVNIDYDPNNPRYFIHTEPEYHDLVKDIGDALGLVQAPGGRPLGNNEYEHNLMWYGSLSRKIEEKRWEEFTEEDEEELITEVFGKGSKAEGWANSQNGVNTCQ